VATEVRHPLFARFFDRFSGLMEKDIGRWRDELVTDLRGRVIEVGAGNGMNFRHYPRTVEEVVAVEPEPYLRARAEQAAKSAPVRVSVRPGLADALEFDDDSFDSAVASLVLCSVPDQADAIAELRRVLKPGGELRFLEHVRSDGAFKARLQITLDRSRIWPKVAGGCRCSRDTVSAIRSAGFRIDRERRIDVGPGWSHTNPHVIGVALNSR
jgi:ubiquinone/menaquinone biosynthesis C-methylase UbiE